MGWLKKYKSLIFLTFLTIGANWFIMDRERVEIYYSQGIYPKLSALMRFFFGYVPFSVGDLLYTLTIFLLLFRLLSFIRAIFIKKEKLRILLQGVVGGIEFFLIVWILFHGLWGFNYHRQSIPVRFGLSTEKVRESELADLARYSLMETNKYAQGRKLGHHLTDTATLFLAYDSLSTIYPSLRLHSRSHKSSIFGVIGNYMGYGGYYNPFTGEAQINDRMPSFFLPFISLHEMAHQIGNAKESEANFIGYLAAMHSADSSILYSANLELFLSSTSVLRKSDSTTVYQLNSELSPIAQKDIKMYKEFIQRYHGPVDRLVTNFYSGFLRMNNQPDGLYSYNKGMLYVMRFLQKKGRIHRS